MQLHQSHLFWFSQIFTQKLQKGPFCTSSPTFSQPWGTVTQATSAHRGTLTMQTPLTVRSVKTIREQKIALWNSFQYQPCEGFAAALYPAAPPRRAGTLWARFQSLSLLLTGTRRQQKLRGKPNGAEPAPASRQPTVTPLNLEIFGFLLENSPFARLHLVLQGGVGCRLSEITQSDLLCKHCPVTFTHLNAFNSATPAFLLISKFG